MTFTGDHFHNCFVPTFAPQYERMRLAGGIPGNTAERTKEGEPIVRAGVWVPLVWLQHVEGPKATWKPFSADQLQALYGREQPKEIDQP